MIWIAFLIPLLGAIVMMIWFRDKLTWWEVALPTAVCLLFTVIFKLSVQQYQVSDTEYWGGLGVRAEYYEPWSTWVTKTCTRQVACGTETDSKGQTSTKYCTEYYDCSYCDETGPRWVLRTSKGETFSINQETYQELRKRWKSRQTFNELNRNIDKHWNCGVDGDMYSIEWNGDPLTAEPTVESHTYENRVQAAHTAFDFVEVSDADVKAYALYDYPEITDYSQPTILGADNIQWLSPNERDTFNKMMNYLNGKLGPKQQLKIWILLYQDQSAISANMQEALWKGGNKNEMVICIGLSSHTNWLQWVRVFSWTPERTLLVDLREDIMNTGKFSGSKIYNVCAKDLTSFKRKQFKDFSYITVDPPFWTIVVTFIVTIISTILLCYWAATNDLEADKFKPWKTVEKWKNY